MMRRFKVTFDIGGWDHAASLAKQYCLESEITGEREMACIFQFKSRFRDFCGRLYDIGCQFTIQSL
jgi:hypothetical protein